MAIKKRSATVVPGASGAAAAVKNPQASKSSFWGELPQHVMSGISRMVPTLIMGGVILAFSQLIAYSWLKIPAEIGIMDALNSGKFSGFDLSLLKFAWLSQSFGGVLFGFAIPMFAAFVANSIGGKLAFPAGFIGGLMSTSKSSFWGELPQHVMSGISRMVPTLIMGGVILAFSQLIAYSWLKIPAEIGIMDALNSGKFSGFDLSLLKFAWLSQSFGGVLFGFAIPMFAAFVANSIGGKLAFPAGFIGGLMSTQPTQLLNFDPSTMQWATSSPVPSTFIGALIISIVAGYLVKWMNQKIQLPDFLLAFKTTFLLPILSAIFVMLAMYYVITPFGGWINGGIRTVLTAAGEKGALMYAMGIAAATAIDLGGPINKAAGFVAFSFTTDHVLPVTARSIAIVIPPIGLGLATIIDRRLTGKRLFNAQLYPQGKTAMFLAFMGISEGAIPFALESPITAIPSYMVGAIVGSTAAVWLGAVQWFPESAIWAWPLVTNLGVYMAGIALGAVITALMVVFLRLMMFRKGKLLIDSL